MTEHQRKMIAGYLPNPRDESLDAFEYYVLDTADRVQRVWVSDLAQLRERDVVKVRNNAGRVIRTAGSDEDGWTPLCHLYDNRIDCKNQEHFGYDNWEELRKLQKEETP